MYQKALSYYIAMLYRSFADFTGGKLQEVGLNLPEQGWGCQSQKN